jgi:hypothetical protein
MVTRGDTVHLKNWDWRKKYAPKRGIDIAYELIDQKNKEAYATFYGSEKDNIYKETINDELANLEKKFILSDRVRTINNLPKFKVISSVKERIQ